MENYISGFDQGDKGRGQALLHLWKSLPEDAGNLLKETAKVKNFERGETIYEAGSRPKYMMCLRKGRVKIVKNVVLGGRAQILRVLKPVEMFGYRAFFAGQIYSTSAVAIDDCDIVFFPLDTILQVIKTNSEFALFLIRHLSEELGSSDEHIVTLTQKHVRGRLADSLLSLEGRFGHMQDGVIDVRMSREDIACLSNMTTSNAIRTLSAFAQEGLIDLRGKSIVILDHEALRDISRLG